MYTTILTRILWFGVLLAAQTFFFGHVHILGYAHAMPYIYFLLLLPVDTPRWLYVVSGFLMGVGVDFFAGTWGAASASMTFVALLTPLFIKGFTPADNQTEDFVPSAATMGWPGFVRIALVLSFLHVVCFFLIEAFSFFQPVRMLIGWLSSALLTFVFLCLFELLRSKNRSHAIR